MVAAQRKDAMQQLGQPIPAPAGDAVKDTDFAHFKADVIQASAAVPVLVDFWAPWCGPCRTLGPLLEKIVRASNGKVKLVKINIDEPQNQPLAQQLRIQSIPAVYAFHNGQPVDGFVGALPESQIKQFVDRLTGGPAGAPGADAVQHLIDEAKAALAEGQAELAAETFAVVLRHDAENVVAMAGLARAHLALGERDEARQILAEIPADQRKHADVTAADAAVALADQAEGATLRLAESERLLAANPADHKARFDLALALVGAGQNEPAMDQLLEIVRRDRNWNEQAARKQLVTLFEALGGTDPLTIAGRRRLSSILFS
jgi:putative thioredoxin